MGTDDALRYNYIIIGAFEDYVRQAYSALEANEGIYLPESPIGKAPRFLQALHKLHWSAKINAKVKLPFKRIWFKKMCGHRFENEKPCCYIFLGGQYIAGSKALQDYIRKRNPENKIVINYGDLIAKKHYKDFEAVRSSADLLVTYDRGEAEKYRIAHYGKRMYSPVQEITEPTAFDTDVYFLGAAKDRLDTILSVYRHLTENGLRCRFDLADVPPERQQPLEGISYISRIPYRESVRRLNEAKCVLEICQSGSNAATMRLVESVTYHRLLLTNANVRDSGYYLPETMLTFGDVAEIDIDTLKKPLPYQAFGGTEQWFSPMQKLQFIESCLSGART